MKKVVLFYVAVCFLGLFDAFSAFAQDETPSLQEQKRQERRVRAQKIVKDDIVIIPDYWGTDGDEPKATAEDASSVKTPITETLETQKEDAALQAAYEQGVDVTNPYALCVAGKPCSACDLAAPIWDGTRCFSISLLTSTDVSSVKTVATVEEEKVTPAVEKDAETPTEQAEARLKDKPTASNVSVEPKKSRRQIQKEKQRARIQAHKEARQKRRLPKENN